MALNILSANRHELHLDGEAGAAGGQAGPSARVPVVVTAGPPTEGALGAPVVPSVTAKEVRAAAVEQQTREARKSKSKTEFGEVKTKASEAKDTGEAAKKAEAVKKAADDLHAKADS